MEVDHNYIIKLSFVVSLLGILMLLIILNHIQPNNNKITSQSNNEEVKITAKILDISNSTNNEYVRIKMEIKKNLTGIIKKEKMKKEKGIKNNETVVISGTLKGNTIFIDEIYR